MSNLPQGVESQQPPRDHCRLIVCAARQVQIEQPCQPVACQGAQALALHEQPIIERRIATIEAIEQIAPIECRRTSNGLWGPRAEQLFEFRDIDSDRGTVQADEFAIDADRRGAHAIECFPKLEDGLFEAVTRLAIRPVTPQESRQFVA
jgi:hypothetical protein